uniref:Uncharacterized protein n=1 Tax=Oryza barthii TaxID=65489 RepID=A0A0D3HTI2_9ORYZ
MAHGGGAHGTGRRIGCVAGRGSWADLGRLSGKKNSAQNYKEESNAAGCGGAPVRRLAAPGIPVCSGLDEARGLGGEARTWVNEYMMLVLREATPNTRESPPASSSAPATAASVSSDLREVGRGSEPAVGSSAAAKILAVWGGSVTPSTVSSGRAARITQSSRANCAACNGGQGDSEAPTAVRIKAWGARSSTSTLGFTTNGLTLRSVDRANVPMEGVKPAAF